MLQLSKWFGRQARTTIFRLPTHVRRALNRRSQRKKSHFEVERKFRISKEEFRALPGQLLSSGFHFAGQVYMTDTFIPSDEGTTRIRRETMNDKTRFLLTCKVWVEVDGNREREEEEEVIPELAATTMISLGEKLSREALAAYSKERDLYTTTFEDGRTATVSLDTVEELGEYSGHYMEIELLVPIGEDVQPARLYIHSLVKTLTGEDRPFVELSYQDMLRKTLSQPRV